MLFIVPIITVLFLAIFISFFFSEGLKNNISGVKLMLLGIHITIFGGIIAVDPNLSLGGFEYLIGLTGLVLSFIGFGRKDGC